MLDKLGISYVVDPTMVRGLDYYNHTIFEIMVKAKSLGSGYTTICGGGRYNGLVEQLGGPETPGIGFGIGLERLLLLLEDEGISLGQQSGLDVYVVNDGEGTNLPALQLVEAARDAGLRAERDYEGRKFKTQMKNAFREKAKLIVILGQKDLADQTVRLRVGHQEDKRVAISDLLADFAKYFQECERG